MDTTSIVKYHYIHYAYSDFFRAILDYIDELYPRFHWKVITTYQKAVEYLSKKAQYGREVDQPNVPALVLDPSGEIIPDDISGRFLWRYPYMMPDFAFKLFTPIYQDANVIITPCFSRFKGEVQVYALLSSIYEYLDFKNLVNIYWAGPDRYFYPFWLHSYIILPKDVYEYHYHNPYTGVDYDVNIPQISTQLVKTTNINEVVYPFRVRPRFKITNVTDASQRLGGADNLPEWRLNITMDYEIELPTYLVIKTDWMPKYINLDIRSGSTYTYYENDYDKNHIPSVMFGAHYEGDFNMLDGTSTDLILPTDMTAVDEYNREFKIRYYHIVTKEQAEDLEDLRIRVPEQISDLNLFLLRYKSIILNYEDDYYTEDDGWILVIRKSVGYKEGDIIELFMYSYTWRTPLT